MEGSAALKAFDGFYHLARQHESVENFAGNLTEAVPEMFVDLQPPSVCRRHSNISFEFSLAFTNSATSCAKTSVTAMSLSVNQICALVQDTFTSGSVPLPGNAECVMWQNLRTIPFQARSASLRWSTFTELLYTLSQLPLRWSPIMRSTLRGPSA